MYPGTIMIFSLTPLSVVSMPERFNPGLLSLSPVCPGKERWAYGLENNVSCYWKNSRSIPAATAEPMTPATLGPMACISKKLEGLYFWPSFCTTRAAIGTAERLRRRSWGSPCHWTVYTSPCQAVHRRRFPPKMRSGPEQ